MQIHFLNYFQQYLLRTIGCIALLLIVSPVWAGLFDDDEARRALTEMRNRYDTTLRDLSNRLEATQRAQMDLTSRLEMLQQENAKLRGNIEVLSHEADTDQQRQKDFYTDLDTRLRNIESTNSDSTKTVKNSDERSGSDIDEQKLYEDALAQFKKGNYSAAMSALSQFIEQYPKSNLAAAAQYWLGTSFYASGNYKGAIHAQQVLIKTYPGATQIPDGWLNIANSQFELGDKKSAKKTLQYLISKYPQTSAAQSAKQRIILLH